MRIALLALARDCACHLPRLFALIDGLSRQGFDVACLIGENGSRDGTGAAIRARAAVDPRVTMIATDAMAAVAGRTARMAAGREMLRAAWVAGGRHGDWVCVLDVDGVLPADPGRIDMAGAVARLRGDEAVAAISATSRPFYYDLLALRAPGLFDYDIGPALAHGARAPLFHYLVHARLVYPGQRAVTRAAAVPLATLSSFNGMALYRAADYAAFRYTGAGVVEACEHVEPHLRLCADGRRVLAGPWFDLDMPAEHGPRGAAGFVAQRVAARLRRP